MNAMNEQRMTRRYALNVTYTRDWAVHGCSSTVQSTGYCSSSDYCDLIQIRYSMCANDWVLEPDDNDGMRE